MYTQFLTILLVLTVVSTDVFAEISDRGDRPRRSTAQRATGARAAARTTPPRTRPSRPTVSRPATRPNRPNRPATSRPATRPNRPNRPVTSRPATRPNRPNRPVTSRPTARPNREQRSTSARTYRHRPNRSSYGSRNYHSPYRYTPRAYSRYSHSPYTSRYSHPRRWRVSDYYGHLRRNNRNYIYINWLLAPSRYNNGYRIFNDYPYYVFNGYRHRYSHFDTCNYQLVDKYTHTVVRNFWNQTCARGYNSCAFDRDNRNSRQYDNQYFCAETFKPSDYNYDRPTYEYNDRDLDYDDNDYNSRSTCYDYDRNSGICYDSN